MEIAYFDEAVEGTSLSDLLNINPSDKTVVVDTCRTYGSTFLSVSALKNCPLVTDLSIFKDYEKKVTIEAIPFFLSPSARVVKDFSQKAYGGEIEYIKINEIYYYCNHWKRIPVTKKDLIDEPISEKDLFYLYKAIKSKNLDYLQSISDTSMPILKLFKSCFSENEFFQFCTNFDSTMYLYPVYGISEICETICMKYSLKGVTFVLNEALSYKKDSDAYPHAFTCDLGTIKAKSINKRKVCQEDQWIRVVLTTKTKFTGNFMGYFDNGTQVMGVNSNAEVCEKEQQLIYLQGSRENLQSNECLEKLQIYSKDILMDLVFNSLFLRVL